MVKKKPQRLHTMCLVSVALLGGLGTTIACGSSDAPPESKVDTGGTAGAGANGGAAGNAGAGVGGAAGSISPMGGAAGTISPAGGANGSGGDGGIINPDASCADDNRKAGVVPVNMLVMFDRSGSMHDVIQGSSPQQTRWQAASTALKAFFQDSGSAGLNVALRFFPHDQPAAGCHNSQCNATACSRELVAIGKLLETAAPTDTQEQALIAAVNGATPAPRGSNNSGGTPTFAALSGAEMWATAYQTAHPGEQTVVVFVTDGQPNGCNENANQIAALAGAAKTSNNVLTYAIGISSEVDEGILDPIARAGGTTEAIMIADGNAQTALLTALQGIRGEVMGCNFTMPEARDPSRPININKVNVNYASGGGAPTTLGSVGSATDCGPGGGWYYDNPTTPTQISLCPATCTTVQADPGAEISIVLGCERAPPPVQ
jgi:Mg-chelatase subunit ChlD